jgi:hypothetical protein
MSNQLVHSAYVAILPGRTGLIRLCHAEPAGCPDCREMLAWTLAREMEFDLSLALNRTTEQYQAELGARPDGAPRCTLEQARDLRRRTCAACFLPISPDGSELYIADFDEPTVAVETTRESLVQRTAIRTRRALHFALWWTAGMILCWMVAQ